MVVDAPLLLITRVVFFRVREADPTSRGATARYQRIRPPSITITEPVM